MLPRETRYDGTALSLAPTAQADSRGVSAPPVHNLIQSPVVSQVLADEVFVGCELNRKQVFEYLRIPVTRP
jgi:hypothetical protein